MADTGAPWNIPYVENADLVKDYPTASLALANAIASGLDAAGNAGIGSNVVQAVKTDTFTTSSGSWVDITGLSVTITPTSATSKVLILTKVAVTTDNTNRGGAIQVVGGNAGNFVGDASSTRIRAASSGIRPDPGYNILDTNVVYLDSPATTSPVTYKVQGGQMRIGNMYINRSDIDTGAGSDNEVSRTASSIIAIEVAA